MHVQQIVVMMAAMAGMVVGLVTMPTVAWFKGLTTWAVAAWRQRRAKAKGKAGARKPNALPLKKKARVATGQVSSATRKKRPGRNCGHG